MREWLQNGCHEDRRCPKNSGADSTHRYQGSRRVYLQVPHHTLYQVSTATIPVIIEGCKKAPKESFWQKVKAEVKKLEKKL
jgi:hypothetical protein